MKRILVVVLLSCVYPLAAAGRIPFSEPRRSGPAAYTQSAIVGASNGFDFLAGWTTSSPFGLHSYVQRVDASGTVPAGPARALDPQAPDSWGLSLAQGRDGYFASWISAQGLNVAVLDAYGRPMRRHTIPVETGPNFQTRSAWNGAAYMVLFGGETVSGIAFDHDANPLFEPLPLATTSSDTRFPEVAPDGTGFLLVTVKNHWDTQPSAGIYGRRIATSGVAGEWLLLRSVASTVSTFALEWDGSRNVIAWSDPFGIWMADVAPGAAEAGPSRQLTPAGTLTDLIVVSGRRWLTSFDPVADSAFVFSIAPDGTLSQPAKIAGRYFGALVSNGAAILSLRERPAPLGDDVIGQFVSPAVGEPFVVAWSAPAQESGRLADGPDQMLAVWDEEVDGLRQVFFGRIGADRTRLDGPGVQLSQTGANIRPAASWNGRHWLVVWSRIESGGFFTVGRRVAADGSVADTEDIVIGGSSYSAAVSVASDGANWLAVWSTTLQEPGCGNFGSAQKLLAARVSPDGEVLDAPLMIDTKTSSLQVDPSVVWTGSRYIAAWNDVCPGWHAPTGTAISAATLSADLTDVEVMQLTEWESTGRGTRVLTPRVVAGPRQTLIAWEHVANDVRTTRFTVLDNAPARGGRRRAVAATLARPVIDGTLVAAGLSAHGFAVLTRRTIPWAPDYQGFFETSITQSGVSEPRMVMIEEPGTFTGGDIVDHGGTRWISQARFDVHEASQRMWALDLE